MIDLKMKTKPKREKGKKESHFTSRRCCKPKGNGINTWITTVELLVTAYAGYSAEKMY
jgi:hypothetical protein